MHHSPAIHLHSRTATIDGLRLHYIEAGAGPPVVLLHGFPEFWYSWRRQIPALVAAGFRVIVPDLRGYNHSDRPVGVAQYRPSLLVRDIAVLIEQVAGGEASVVGHDWGGVVAWRLAAERPELLRKLAVLNAPHPQRFFDVLRKNPSQWLRSAYALFFQLPWLPEALIRAGDFWLLRRIFRDQPTNPAAFTPADIEQYKQVFARPGGLTGPLNYYRAALRWSSDLSSKSPVIRTPTLLIWGERDPHLSLRLSEGLERWVPELRVERLPQASHWVQNDDPSRVNQLLIDFFSTLPGCGEER